MKEAIQSILRKHTDIQLALLFGSRSTPIFRADSDIDLAIYTEPRLTAKRKREILSDLSLAFGLPVDLIDLNRAGEPIVGQALKGKRLVGSDVAYAKVLSRHLIDHADFAPLRNNILSERRNKWIQT